MNPAQGAQALQVAFGHHQAGRLEEAEKHYRQLRTTQPANFEVWHLSGILALQRQQWEPAKEAFIRALRLNPKSASCEHKYGVALLLSGKRQESLRHFKTAIAIDPKIPDAYVSLAQASRDLGDLPGAKEAFKKALELQPKNAEVLDAFGALVADTEGLGAAFPFFEKATALNPAQAQGWCNLGLSLSHLSRFTEAEAAFNKAIALKPNLSRAHLGLGILKQATYRLEEAAAAFGKARDLNPTDGDAQSGRLLTLHYLDGIEKTSLFEEHRAFGAAASAQAARRGSIPVTASTWDGKRPLRVGFLSPDLRRHAVAYFLEPLLQALEGERFQVFLYHDHHQVDDMSKRLMTLCPRWKNFAGQPDATVEAALRADTLDVLFDVAGHTGKNRLSLFARRLAPVQITYLGYPDTTGLSEMDFRFTDAHCDPEGEEAFHSETLVRFSPVAWAYSPPREAPELAAPPVRDHVVFGCFNNFAKVSDFTLRLWSEVLAAVPGSRLRLKGHDLTSDFVRPEIERRTAAAGIALDRLELLGRLPNIHSHLSHYNDVDVALDPFPYSGTTTTCEALWMGVPVITLKGDRHVSRVSSSLLHAAGLEAHVAATREDYVRLAAALANDRPSRATLRATLRDRLLASELMKHREQGERFASAVLACASKRLGR